MINKIYLRRCSRVILPKARGITDESSIATMTEVLGTLGYDFSDEIVDQLKQTEQEAAERFFKSLINSIRNLTGDHVKFDPMYPNFPKQVQEMSKFHLYLNAIKHYFTLERPHYERSRREPLSEIIAIKRIKLGSTDHFENIFENILASNSPFSPQDKEDVSWYVSQHRDTVDLHLPTSFVSKENFAFIAAELLRKTKSHSIIDQHIKTATDVLRIATSLSDGDVSLAESCKFGNFKRSERLRIIGWLEVIPNAAEDMKRWKKRWIRLAERLHPGDYANRFPKTFKVFQQLRNNEYIETFNSKLEAHLEESNLSEALFILNSRPGELIRKIDMLYRRGLNPDQIIDSITLTADQVSTQVLLQAHCHFKKRQRHFPGRAFFPKGNAAKLYHMANIHEPISEEFSKKLISVLDSVLIRRFEKLQPLGSCYLDHKLSDHLVPFSPRSASKSLRTLVRGSRMNLPDCSTLRFFIWWKNGNQRADLDLSAAVYGNNYQYIDTLAYYNLRNFGGHHSGDIVDAPNGAAEFIDLDLEKCKQNAVRYIVMCVTSYTEQPFCDLPECFAGWMSRSQPKSGEIFEPKTVIDKADLATKNRISLPAIFDLQENKVIWVDIGLTSNPRYQINVDSNKFGVSLILQAMLEQKRPDLKTLFDLHIRARGRYTVDQANADTIFSMTEGITPFDHDIICSKFL